MDLKPFKFLLGLLCSALSAEASPPRPQYSANHYYYYYLMGRYHLNIGNAEDAVEYLETARLLNKESPIIARELSELYYIGGNYEAALQHASAVYGAMPDDLEFLEYYAELLIKNERKDRAAEILKDMIEAAPDNEGYRFRMAAIYEHSGDLKSAVNQYMEVIKRDKGNIFARIALADVYLSFEEYSAAITHYKSAIKHGADAKDVYLQIGRIYHRQGKSRKAVRYVQRAINESPEDWIAHATLADIYIENEEIDKAEEVLKTLVEKYPNEYASQMRLGIFYMETDESDRAKEVFSKLSELFPEEYSVWLFLSFMQEHLG
ncbi:MAG: tetratricopeptide repeat protein, partial [Elusimicrobia bacterium]|nr:tetratricopeptide repeat protein [Elusimicrobiota bacterium]